MYDNGTSLWYNINHVGQAMDCKPFHRSHDEQIKLVSDLFWFEAGAVKGLGDEIEKILAQDEEIDEKRRSAIASSVTERCNQIERLADEKL